MRLAAHIFDGGLRFVDSHHLTVSVEVNRSWRERLFSWPWRPMQRTRWTHKPDPNYYVVGKTVYCHPAMRAEFEREFRKLEVRNG